MSDIPETLADTLTLTLTNRVLVQRALAAQRPKTKHSRPMWALTKDLFLVDPTVARAICYKYGFDPDKEVYPFSATPDRHED